MNRPVTPADWDRWAYLFPGDLQTSVWDRSVPREVYGEIARLKPEADISKTPTRIKPNGRVRMEAGWTRKRSTEADIASWKQDPRYNVLLVTRNVRAIDIDIADQALADEVEQLIAGLLQLWLPKRFRENSGKRTLFLRIEPTVPMSKRVIRVLHPQAGQIEFLADSQQTVLAGMHPSGAVHQHAWFDRYEGGAPTIPQSAVEQMWDVLRHKFRDDDPTSKPLMNRQESTGLALHSMMRVEAEDPVVSYLFETGRVLSVAGDGKINVECPWKDPGPGHKGHSMDSGETQSTYFPFGLRGQPNGYKCQHAGCDGKHREQFLEAIGFTAFQLEQNFMADAVERPPRPVVEIEHSIPVPPTVNDYAVQPSSSNAEILAVLDMPPVSFASELALRRKRGGDYYPSMANLMSILREDTPFIQARYDRFLDRVEVRLGAVKEYKALDDVLVARCAELLERRYHIEFERAKISIGIETLAKYNQYDSAHIWLVKQEWDGQSRIDRFAVDVLKACDDAYGVALSRYLWVSMAARVLHPGVKVDMATVLVSPKQGTGKSSLVRSLAPCAEWFAEVDLSNRDDDLMRTMRGKAVLEISEMRGLSARDSDSTKAFVTRQVDAWVPKYREYETTYPRRSVFVGTTNHKRFLIDASGNRRWLPIRVATSDRFLDWPRFRECSALYWAEAKKLIEQFADVQEAVEHFARGVDALAEPARLGSLRIDDQMDEAKGFLAAQDPRNPISTRALMAALQMRNNVDSYRAHAILRMLGYEELDGTNLWQKKVLTQDFVL